MKKRKPQANEVGEWTLTKTIRFEAAHKLVNHDGKCERLHGHSWTADIECRGYSLTARGPKKGMVLDYGDISEAVKPIVDDVLDHHYLNQTLLTDAPTSEVVAQWIYNWLRDVAKLRGLHAVTVHETCTSACKYKPKDAKKIKRELVTWNGVDGV